MSIPGFQAASRCHQRVFPRTATNIQHAPSNRASFSELLGRRLWSAYVPGWIS
jgi:hypothetical protein